MSPCERGLRLWTGRSGRGLIGELSFSEAPGVKRHHFLEAVEVEGESRKTSSGVKMSRGAAKMLLRTWGTVGGSLVLSEKRLGIACFLFFFFNQQTVAHPLRPHASFSCPRKSSRFLKAVIRSFLWVPTASDSSLYYNPHSTPSPEMGGQGGPQDGSDF